MPPSPNYDNALATIEQRLWAFKPDSFYSEAAIQSYVAKHFEFVNPTNLPEAPSTGIIHWGKKEKVVARLISHLPPLCTDFTHRNGLRSKTLSQSIGRSGCLS